MDGHRNYHISKVSQTENNKYHMRSQYVESNKNDMKEWTKQKQTQRFSNQIYHYQR